MQIESVMNPVFADGSGKRINLMVKFEHLSSAVPFTAAQEDTEAHGAGLFSRALAGEFGAVAAFVPHVPTAEEIKSAMVATVQDHLDSVARERGYDGILSLASYATSTHPPFAAEGQAGLNWRDAVWGYCYQVLADVQSGTRTIPTAEALIAELPVMVWP